MRLSILWLDRWIVPAALSVQDAEGALMMSGWFSRVAGRVHVYRTSRYLTALTRRLRSDRRGNVAMMVAVSALPLLTAVGVGVDMSSLVEARARLQNAADAAALAGASIYTSDNQKDNAVASAQSYFDRYAKGGFTTLSGVASAGSARTIILTHLIQRAEVHSVS